MDNRETKNKDQGAFACSDLSYIQTGLTKREYFAGLAMQGLLTRSAGINDQLADEISGQPLYVATWSIEMADQLIEELEKKQ